MNKQQTTNQMHAHVLADNPTPMENLIQDKEVTYVTLFVGPTVEAVLGWEVPFSMVGEPEEAGNLDKLLQQYNT